MGDRAIDVAALAQLLEGLTTRCGPELKRFAGTRFDRGAASSLNDHLSSMVATTLKSVLSLLWNGSAKSGLTPSQSFFFWPGYIHHASTNPGRIDTIPRPGTKGAIELYHLIRNRKDGVGFSGGRFDSPRHHLALSAWMYLLYGVRLDDVRYLGFTEWFRKNGKPLIRLADGSKRHLIALELTDQASESSEQGGILTLPWIGQRPNERFEELRMVLNERICFKDWDQKKVESPDRFPPVSVDPVSDKHPDTSTIHAASDQIFALLLDSIFAGTQACPIQVNACTEHCELVETCQHREICQIVRQTSEWLRSVGLPDASLALENARNVGKMLLQDAQMDPIRSSFYYVIPLVSTVEIRGDFLIRPELGTVNLYTSDRLQPEALSLLKPYLDSIYQQVRLLEATSAKEQRQKSIFAHQMTDMMSMVTRGEVVDKIGPFERQVLWHLSAEILLFGSTHFDASEDVTGHGDFGGGSVFDEDSLVDTLITFSALQGLKRILRGPGTSLQIRDPDLTDALGKQRQDLALMGKEKLFRKLYAATESARVADLAPALLKELGFETTGTPPWWKKCVGFVLIFHHCFWQAVRHAYLARLHDQDFALSSRPTYLKLEWSPHCVTIRNAMAFESGPEWTGNDRAYVEEVSRRQRKSSGYFQVDVSNTGSQLEFVLKILHIGAGN